MRLRQREGAWQARGRRVGGVSADQGFLAHVVAGRVPEGLLVLPERVVLTESPCGTPFPREAD